MGADDQGAVPSKRSKYPKKWFCLMPYRTHKFKYQEVNYKRGKGVIIFFTSHHTENFLLKGKNFTHGLNEAITSIFNIKGS